MSFQRVASDMAKRQGISMERASAMLASHTRNLMKKKKISTKHGIPKGVFDKFKNRMVS